MDNIRAHIAYAQIHPFSVCHVSCLTWSTQAHTLCHLSYLGNTFPTSDAGSWALCSSVSFVALLLQLQLQKDASIIVMA